MSSESQRVTMGFLKRFFMNALHEGRVGEGHDSSFERLTDEELEAHLGVSKYGDFQLTEAIRPSYDLRVVPSQGYRFDAYRDETSGDIVPVLMAAASREVLFDLFMEFLDGLGSAVDVVLETSHDERRGRHCDLYREHIDMPVLKSILWDFEDLLLNDGCTGIAVINPRTPQEVQFDEHKLLIAYGEPLATFENALKTFEVERDDTIRFITEAEHVHSSRDEYVRQFQQLRMRLGMEEDT